MSLSLPKKTTTLGKVRLLLWKNFLLQKHHYLQTFFDICLPVIFFASFVFLYACTAKPTTEQHAEQKYPSESIDSFNDLWFDLSIFGVNIEHTLVFTPNNAIFKALADQVSERLNLNDPIGVDDRKQLQDTVVIDNCIAGIEFHHPNDTTEMPKNLVYSLRFPAEMRTSRSVTHWQTNLLYSVGAHLYQYLNGPDKFYHDEGFLTVQNAIAKAFVKINSNASIEIDTIYTRKFPSPAYTFDVPAHALRELTPFFFVVVLCFVFMNTVRFVSNEKEKQLKEAMKIMGLSSWMHYLGWFIRTLVMLSITMACITILLTVPCFGAPSAVFARTSFFGLFSFCFGYCINLIAFSFLICAFFANSKSAVTAAMALWFVTSIPYIIIDEDNFSVTIKAIMCIFPNTALSYGIDIIDNWEVMEEGLNWSTAFREQNLIVYSDLTIATIFGLFMIYAILFFLITVYVENVMPGSYGVAKPWYFLFTKKFWLNSNTYQTFEEQNFNELDLIQSSVGRTNFESEPINRPIGIEAKNLTKKFLNDTAVVSNLRLNVYYDQITCLLGHNGAGKTTTISMLTGMLEPTSGTALINGYDIRRDMDLARSSIGFCPQHNILFDELTVREHILFYCCLKGLSNDEAEHEVQKYVETMGLEGKENAMSSTLSGGMKRKLSVVIALCGKSKVVFLDEPTSGMDPCARRSLWDILLTEKKDRTILLTTHFMDEADVLSDRIAILADGELKCTGSTFFLKKRYGTGHHLICTKDRDCDSQLVTELLQKYIPEIQIESESDSELSYALPDDRNELFADMLEKLESMELELHLSGFGISLTTIEEVFLKLGNSESSPSSNGTANHSSVTEITLNDNQNLLHGVSLWKNQAIAVFRKRYLCWLRAFSSYLYYSIFVIFMIGLLTFRFGGLVPKSEKMPALNINLDKYKSPIIVLQESNSKIATQYEQNVIESSAVLLKVHKDMQTALLELAKMSPKDYKFRYVTAMSVENQSITAWYNDQAVHAAPLTLSLAHNAIIQSFFGHSYSIQLTNDPLEFRPALLANSTDIWEAIVDSAFEFLFSFVIYIIMSILSAKYTSFYIEEKQSNAKFLQYVSGANVPVFWTVSILWDWITSAIIVALIILTLAFGQQKQIHSFDELAAVALILLIYNFAMIPVVCIWSLIFTKPSLGRTVVSIFNVIIAPSLYLAYLIVVLFLSAGSFLRSMSMAPDLRSFFLWPYPPLCMFDALITYQLFRNRISLTESIFTTDRHGIGVALAAMILTGITAYIILIVIEMGTFRVIKLYIMEYFKQSYRNDDDNGDDDEDDDVLAEKMRIQQMTSGELRSEAIVMKNLSKKYDGFDAVKDVSLSIKRAECFGLLGKNGAGKTTIFKMLTGETTPSNGKIFIDGSDQKYNLLEIYQTTGYCPQFDALLSSLTCRETLEIFAMLRGIPAANVKEYAEIYARNLDFIQHIDKKVIHLSGGNKRKLSASLAIIGNLNVIFLDEPTTGLDPATKRNLWNVINQLRKAGKSIVLTSHSMEECEALCTQITVLVNGKCKCLGSPQHLKNKFCKGFELKIKVKHHNTNNNNHIDDVNDNESFETNLNDVKNFIANTFDGAIFRDEYQGVITYSIPFQSIKWSNVFSEMEKAKQNYQIEDYSISQNSLEQVVLKLLKDQTEQTEPYFYGADINNLLLRV